MGYAQEQRVRFIDCMLLYYGSVGRRELCDYFGLGEATATRDLKAYRDAAPNNMIFNPGSKRWEKSGTFVRVYG